jgi:hypothetical protein
LINAPALAKENGINVVVEKGSEAEASQKSLRIAVKVGSTTVNITGTSKITI